MTQSILEAPKSMMRQIKFVRLTHNYPGKVPLNTPIDLLDPEELISGYEKDATIEERVIGIVPTGRRATCYHREEVLSDFVTMLSIQ